VLVGAIDHPDAARHTQPDEALQGFASNGVMTIAALYIVRRGPARRPGAMAWISAVLRRAALADGCPGQADVRHHALSAVINNTPVVALFIPVAQEWASRFGYSISKLLLPMNHVVILAGMCTLIAPAPT